MSNLTLRTSNKPLYGYKPVRLFVRIGFGILGIISIVGGGYWASQLYLFDANGATAQGTIIGIEKRASTKGSDILMGISFVAADGKQYYIQSSPFPLTRPVVGDTKKVVYDKKNPENARTDTVATICLVIILTILVGLAFVRVVFYAKYQLVSRAWVPFTANWGLKKK